MDLEIEMLERIREGVEHHAGECSRPCHAILLNPGNWELIGWDEVLGLPVLPDERVQAKRFEIVCGTAVGGQLGVHPVVWTSDSSARTLHVEPPMPPQLP